jgi:hypothetical protein
MNLKPYRYVNPLGVFSYLFYSMLDHRCLLSIPAHVTISSPEYFSVLAPLLAENEIMLLSQAPVRKTATNARGDPLR